METLTNKTQRDISFDIMKFLAIFLVVYAHGLQHFIYHMNSFSEDVVWREIQSFHMPLFMTIAGYFAVQSMNMTPLNFVRKKAVTLLLPCVIWQIIAFPLSNSSSIIEFFNLCVVNFWFLKSVFVCYILAYLTFLLFRGLSFPNNSQLLMWGGIFLIGTMFIPLFDLPRMYPCFLLGMMIKKSKLTESCYMPIILLLALIVFVVLSYIWCNDSNIWTSSISLMNALLGNNSWYDFSYNYIMKLAIGFAGSMLIITALKLLLPKQHKKIFDMLAKVGSRTLGIYILQTYLLERIMSRFISLEASVFNYVVGIPLISSAVIVICYYMILVIEKNKYCALLLLGKLNR